jgi:hypothetical protein
MSAGGNVPGVKRLWTVCVKLSVVGLVVHEGLVFGGGRE